MTFVKSHDVLVIFLHQKPNNVKSIKVALYAMTISCILLSCKKGDSDTGESCEEDNTAETTFTNSGSIPLQVEVATSLTPQFEPINPTISVVLQPGASVKKGLYAEQYFIIWSRDCPTNCSTITYYSKTYAACSDNQETQGLAE